MIAKIRADFAELGNLEKASAAPRGRWARLRQRLAAAAKAVVEDRTEPGKLALGVAVGFTVGLTPLFGLHLLICVALAITLRLNKLVVYAAAHVSMPPLIPLIAVGCIQSGHLAAHGRLLPLDFEAIDRLRHSFLAYWLGGALLNGALLGGPLGLGVWAVARRRQRQGASGRVNAAWLQRLYEAFRPDGRLAAEMLRGKVAHDVVYAEVLASTTGIRTLLDLGGGHGALPLLLGLARPELAWARVVDWDEEKLRRGQAAATRLGLPVTFERADVFGEVTLGQPVDCIALIDLLHYRALAEQRQLVDRLAAALGPGGLLIIRDMDADQRWRTRVTVMQERLSLLVRRTRAEQIVPRSGQDLVRQLASHGLEVTARRCHGRLPFSNTLWLARRRG